MARNTASDTDGEVRTVNDGLFEALAQLDALLAAAVEKAEKAFGPQAALDGLRGLHLGADDVRRELAREAGVPGLSVSLQSVDEALRCDMRFRWLIEAFGLSATDAAVILVALAPEIDLRYERIYAFLQDDITRKRPAVDLVLHLFARDRAERSALLASLAGDAPLLTQHLIELRGADDAPLSARAIHLDAQITRLLLQHTGLDPRLRGWCRLEVPGTELTALALPAAQRLQLALIAARARSAAAPLRLHLQGPHGAGKLQAARALAHVLDAPLLAADLRGAREAPQGFMEAVRILVREAWLLGGVLFLHGFDALLDARERQLLRALAEGLDGNPVPAVIASRHPWPTLAATPLGFHTLVLSYPDFDTRCAAWRAELHGRGMACSDAQARILASRFRLTPAQIGEAVASAAARERFDGNDEAGDEIALEHLCFAARAQSGQELMQLATKVDPRAGWDDIVLPPDTLEQLHEICDRALNARRVLEEWGFSRRLSLGKGITALFAGPSGTGKTLAAEIVARELSVDLYRIDLSRIISKYIGETEKNLDRVFSAAQDANAVLFFDEADALFGKRSEVRDSHDRYANVEVSYLLQKMEEFEGVAILATNLRQNLDDAFMRRLAFTVHFPFPEEADRLRIWQAIWPTQVPLAEDVDLAYLAREFKLSGGNIKNTALAAAYGAAADGGMVTQAHLLHATRREFQKMGRALPPVQLTLRPPRMEQRS